jgi:hypothetical protein
MVCCLMSMWGFACNKLCMSWCVSPSARARGGPSLIAIMKVPIHDGRSRRVVMWKSRSVLCSVCCVKSVKHPTKQKRVERITDDSSAARRTRTPESIYN